jgi:hypothetical protein
VIAPGAAVVVVKDLAVDVVVVEPGSALLPPRSQPVISSDKAANRTARRATYET